MFLSTVLAGEDAVGYYLLQDVGQLYRVSFCEALPVFEIPLNVPVELSYESIQDGVLYSCCKPRSLAVNAAAPTAGSARRALWGDTISTPTRPTFLIYLVSMCGFSMPPVATTSVSDPKTS
jgi:hypothetical protein